MSQSLAMTVNGRAVSVTVDDPDMPLPMRCATTSA